MPGYIIGSFINGIDVIISAHAITALYILYFLISNIFGGGVILRKNLNFF